MLESFALWFIDFGLSFLIQSCGWAEQSKSFMYIHLGTIIFGIIVLIAVCLYLKGSSAKIKKTSLLLALSTFRCIVVTLFATWVASQIFDIGFYTAYMIMSFGQCLCTSNKKKKK